VRFANKLVLSLSAIFFAATLSVSVLGCSETSLIGQPGAGLPTRVEAIIEVSSDHPSDPLLVDFGEVYAGDTREKDVMIRNIGTDTLHIQGQDRLSAASHPVIADRIETGTYAMAAAITGGDVVLEGARADLMEASQVPRAGE